MRGRYFFTLFLLIQILFLFFISFFPREVELFYSNGMYLKIAPFSRRFMGAIPFSVGDFMYLMILLWVINWFWTIRKKGKAEREKHLLQIVNCLSLFCFLFHVLWAFNYYREPLYEKMKLKKTFTDKEFLVFTKKLISKTNSIQYCITQDPNSKIVFPFSQQKTFEMNVNGYKNLALECRDFSYSNLSIKKSLFSLPLTYMGFSGYLNPFTNEAQVNSLIPMYNFPVTSCHEMAHQMGFASESDCNFIGFLASIKNENLYFQYSGYNFALQYCLRNWKVRNPEILEQLIKTIHPGILKNFQESKEFWEHYETPIEKGFKIFYDQFLKLNNQKDGLESYSKFVDLMVNSDNKKSSPLKIF